MPDIRQIERQLHMLLILSESKQGYTIQELHRSMRKLGIDVSKKTIERDIDDISRLFYIYEENVDGEILYKAKKLKIENITFTISELISLYFLQQVVKSYRNVDVGKNAGDLIQKILAQAPAINQSYIDSISDLFVVDPSNILQEKYIDGDQIQIVRESIEKGIKLKLEYFSFSNNESTTRIIEPYTLEIREGCYHLIGFCNLRNEIRDFRISRIRKLEMLDESFERPENFYEEYSKKRFDKMTSDEQITLKIIFEGQVARYIKEYESHKADKITDLSKDRILFEKKTTYTPDILPWVLRFGADAEVIEPETLRFEIDWEVKRMTRKYDK